MADPIGTFSGLASGIQWRDMIDQIMKLETQRKLKPLQDSEAVQNGRRDAWNTLNSLLGSFSDAAKGLRDGSAFAAFRVTAANSPTTGRPLFGATASSAAAPGTYSVEVRALATAQKLRGERVASTTDALGYAGSVTVNGREIQISASDSLADVRDRINAANGGTGATGVTASILDVSPTEHYLTLTADATGARGIALSDTEGVLAQLGISTGSRSQELADAGSAIADVLGLSPKPPVRTIVVDGKEVTVDLSTDTLQSLQEKIAQAGVDASIVTTPGEGGGSTYSLEVHGNVWGAADDEETAAVLSALGFTRRNQVAAGSDARVRIDGLDVVRSSNTISDALAGVTLELQAAEPGQSLSLAVRRDVDAIVQKVQGFADAFNAIVGFHAQQRQNGGALASNASVRSMIGALRNVFLSDVPGVAAGELNRLGLTGVELTRDGTLSVDAERLKRTLATDFNGTRALFATHAAATGSGLSYVGGTDATQPGDHAVTITRAATVASHTGDGAAQLPAWDGVYHAGSGVANRMTVVDAYTGKSVSVDLAEGQTVAQIATALQSAFTADGLSLEATTSGGDLVIRGTRYGSAASFTVSYAEYDAATSTTLASDLSSPIHFAAGSYAGTDVEGTIGGEAATGAGQILTASTGAAAGLSVRYAGTADAASGSVSYVVGAGDRLQALLDAFTRSGDGLIAQNLDGISRSVARLQDRQLDAQGRLDRYQASLIRQYTAMEAALSRLQAQGNWLASQINSLQSQGA